MSAPNFESESVLPPHHTDEGAIFHAFPIRSELLCPNHLPIIADFSCAAPGSQAETRWEQDVSEWIRQPKGEGGALDAAALDNTLVWFFFDNDFGQKRNLIGYGSLGESRIPVGDNVIDAWIIPYFGIATAFQGQPKLVDKRFRYARQIFQFLIDVAKQKETHRNMFLYVDHENKKAIENFYPDFGFTVLGKEIDETDGRVWILMHRDLAD